LTGSEDLRTNANPKLLVGRYLYPDAAWRKYADGTKHLSPITKMIMGFDGLSSEGVLDATSYIVLAEWPSDPDVYQALQLVAKETGCRLVNPYLEGTFEEYFAMHFKKLEE
jgi:hypothetical protein